ncbi:MAG: DHH family phosphoesterase [Candidatus Marsarchaeota archaeon]|nr:DHH family phosphoesterase [Candidatus Marsarchaeota archaeon]
MAKGLVSCIKHNTADGQADYFVVVHDDTTSVRSLKSAMALGLGEAGELEVAEGRVEKFEPEDDGKERKAIEKAIADMAAGMLKGSVRKIGVGAIDPVTEKMWERLRGAMRLLARKLMIGAPIVIRFHNDIDGASGAYALYKALSAAMGTGELIAYKPNISWRMHGSVFYSAEDATNDTLVCNNYECVEKPLLIVIDFGTAEESNAGLEIAKEKFDIIWLDHHPIIEGFKGKELEHYINPWQFGGDSNYTAGFLACVFAHTLEDVDTKEMEEASFIGDYSIYSKPTVGSRRLAALLDLLTSDTRVISGMKGNLTPESVDSVLKDKAKSDELIAYAESRVAEMLDLALGSIKVYNADSIRIYVADFEAIRTNDQERYPLPGRFASKLLGRIEELNKSPCILLLHFGYFISTRMSKKLIGKVDLLGALEKVHADYSNYVDSTGGHSNAASIKMNGGEMKKAIIKDVVDTLKEEIEGG